MVIRPNMSRKEVEGTKAFKQYRSHNVAHVLDTFDLHVDPVDESIAQWLLKDGFYEAWITSWFTKVIEPDWNCLDVGASFGYYTGVLSCLAPEGKVVAVEPHPETVKMLNRSKKDNGWENVEILPYAVGEFDRTMNLVVPVTAQGGASFTVFKPELGKTVKFPVEVKRLDDITDIEFDFVKLDIEGYEPAAMRGAERILSNNPLIAIEVLGGFASKDFVEYLFDNYNVWNISVNGEYEDTTPETVMASEWAMLAIRK